MRRPFLSCMARTASSSTLQAKYQHSPSASFADFLELHPSVDPLSSRSSAMYVLSGVNPSKIVPKPGTQDVSPHSNVLCTTKPCLLTPVIDLEKAVLTRTSAQGRLSMLRFVSLHLSHPDYVDNPDREYDPQYKFTSEKEAIWSYWADFFQPSSKQQSLTFPVLEHLCLDFSHWKLGRGDERSELRVCILLPCQMSSKTCAKPLPLD